MSEPDFPLNEDKTEGVNPGEHATGEEDHEADGKDLEEQAAHEMGPEEHDRRLAAFFEEPHPDHEE